MHFWLTGNITFLNIQQFLPPHLSQIRQILPQIQQVNYTMLLTQIFYIVLYKHSALLSHCLHFCIIPPNVCKCYKDYFSLRPIYSYILPLAVYSGGQDQYYRRSSWHCEEASGGQEQYYITSSWHWVTLWVTLTFRHSLTLPDKKGKNVNLNRKNVWKGLQICTCRFLDMPITMHYVRTLCDKYFWSYDGLFVIFNRKVYTWGSETLCSGRMGPKEDCCIDPIPFWWF